MYTVEEALEQTRKDMTQRNYVELSLEISSAQATAHRRVIKALSYQQFQEVQEVGLSIHAQYVKINQICNEPELLALVAKAGTLLSNRLQFQLMYAGRIRPSDNIN